MLQPGWLQAKDSQACNKQQKRCAECSYRLGKVAGIHRASWTAIAYCCSFSAAAALLQWYAAFLGHSLMASVYSANACSYCLALKPWPPMSFALHATFVAMLAHVYWPVLKVPDCTLFYKIGRHKLDSQNSQIRLICTFSVLQRVQQNAFSITNLSASASSYSPSAHHGTSAP